MSSSLTPPLSCQNIELKTRNRPNQTEGGGGGSVVADNTEDRLDGSERANSNRGQSGKKKSRPRRRNNINKLMSVKFDKSAPLVEIADESADCGHCSQVFISQTTLHLGLQDQQEQQQEPQQEQRAHRSESGDTLGKHNDNNNDNGATAASADRDNGDLEHDNRQRHRQTELIQQLQTRAPDAPSNSSSLSGPAAASKPQQSEPGACRGDIEPASASENSREENSSKTSEDLRSQPVGDRKDGHSADQTRAQATRQPPLADKRTPLVPTDSNSSSSSKCTKSTKAQQASPSKLATNSPAGPQKRRPVLANSITAGLPRGASRPERKQQSSDGAMGESPVLVPTIDNGYEGGELAGLVKQDRKLSQSSSGHESGSQLADFMTGSASAWSTPVLTNSRHSSAVCVDIELNECDRSNRNSYATSSKHGVNGDINYAGERNCRAKATSTIKTAPATSAASSIRRSWSATDCAFMDVSQLANGSSKLVSRGHKLDNNYKRLNQDAQHHPAPMKRTISRSMLEFDPSVGVNEKFLVYWKNLTFGYPPGLLTRLSRSSRLLGARNKPTTATEIASQQREQEKQGQNDNAVVLNNVSGMIGSNQLVAIIGPSGCGKTTLLQFLAGNNGRQQDRLRICGLSEPKVAFIGQDDCLLPGLTARETLMYASRLQNGAHNFDHASHIEPILAELGLAECANRCVSKLSGGQAKRVTIAQELLYPTNLLILDEVTSGLDASTSYSIVKLLKYLVSDSAYPMSIVISIHQPSARLFSVFDKVYVMSAGCCLYEGSCNLAKINAHLARFNLECPRYHNIADYLIELACLTSAASSGAGAGAGAALPASAGTNGAQDDDHDEPDAGGRVDEPFLHQSNGRAAAKGQSNGGCHNSNVVEQQQQQQQSASSRVLDQMIAFQRKQTEYSIEQLRQSSDLIVVFDGAPDQARHADGRSASPSASDDSSNTSQTQLASTETSLYLAIEQARRRRLKPFMDHFAVHFERSLMRIRRSYILTYLQLITYIILGVQLATFYGTDLGQVSGCPRLPKNLMTWILTSNSGDDDEHTGNSSSGSSSSSRGGTEDSGGGGDTAHEMRRIQENMNFLLVAVMTATFAALEITVITFPMEAKTIKREWRNGWYRVSSYFMGRTLADLPFQLAFVMIFCLLIYVLTGQLGLATWRFASFVLIIVMTALIAQSIGLIFGALFMNNLPAAVFTAPLAIFPTLLFSGFFSRVSQVSAFYRPLTYLSHFRYAFDALLVTLYGYDRCNCDQAVLTSYHASMANQTSSMRDVFHLLFGASDCISASATAAPAPPGADHLSSSHAFAASAAPSSDTNEIADSSGGGLVSHEDLAAIRAGNQSLASTLMSILTSTTTMAPASLPSTPASGDPSQSLKHIEDMIVDTVFQQMASSTGPDLGLSSNDTAPGDAGSGGEQTSVMDRLADKFATKLTAMLNRQSNFGHPMPAECRKFNSYLMTEFDLTDEDLLFGLSMLFIAVLLTRIVCNFILHFTIATRIR